MKPPSDLADLEREEPAVERPGTGGLVTLVDLISLLLAFFVLALSMSSLDPEQRQVARASLARAFGSTSAEADGSRQSVDRQAPNRLRSTEYLASVLARSAGTDATLQLLKVNALGNRLVLAIPPELLFVTQSGGLREEALPIVAAVAESLRHLSLPVAVAVEAPIGGGERWRLAMDAASQVTEALAEAGYPGAPAVIAAGGGATALETGALISQIPMDRDAPAAVVCICTWR